MASIRVLHFGDLHIGMENYGRIDPDTGISLGRDTEVLCQALVDSVDEQKSTARRITQPDNAEVVRGDLVVTK